MNDTRMKKLFSVMPIRLVFIMFVLVDSFVLAKREPFRYDIIHSTPYGRYQFDDWEELKKHLSTSILRGNDINAIDNNFFHANDILVSLAQMKLQESEKKVVRKFLLSFWHEYVYDVRFEQLLDSLEKNTVPHEKLIFYDNFLFMPSNILCVVAALHPEEEEINKTGKMLISYYQRHPRAEDYLIRFLSDLQFFKSIASAKTFLENSDFSSFPLKTRKRIDDFHVACLANMTKTQRETWDFLLQQHLTFLREANTGKTEWEIVDNCDTLSKIFLAIYPKPDYTVLIERATTDNVQQKFFFISQLQFLVFYQHTKEPLSRTEKEMISETIKQFIDNNKNPDTPEKKQIYTFIVKNNNSMMNRLTEIVE